jgi:hypothetical protein
MNQLVRQMGIWHLFRKRTPENAITSNMPQLLQISPSPKLIVPNSFQLIDSTAKFNPETSGRSLKPSRLPRPPIKRESPGVFAHSDTSSAISSDISSWLSQVSSSLTAETSASSWLSSAALQHPLTPSRGPATHLTKGLSKAEGLDSWLEDTAWASTNIAAATRDEIVAPSSPPDLSMGDVAPEDTRSNYEQQPESEKFSVESAQENELSDLMSSMKVDSWAIESHSSWSFGRNTGFPNPRSGHGHDRYIFNAQPRGFFQVGLVIAALYYCDTQSHAITNFIGPQTRKYRKRSFIVLDTFTDSFIALSIKACKSTRFATPYHLKSSVLYNLDDDGRPVSPGEAERTTTFTKTETMKPIAIRPACKQCLRIPPNSRIGYSNTDAIRFAYTMPILHLGTVDARSLGSFKQYSALARTTMPPQTQQPTKRPKARSGEKAVEEAVWKPMEFSVEPFVFHRPGGNIAGDEELTEHMRYESAREFDYRDLDLGSG